LRVISGELRGKRLLSPKGSNTRPTADRFKETLFNILQNRVYGSRFLDIFSGTGAMGIEALSRGATKAVFIDSSAECGELIKKNLAGTSVISSAVILISDFVSALKNLGNKNEKFDIIFLDPPYYNEFTEKAIEAVVANNLLADDGIIVSEQASDSPLFEIIGLDIYDVRKYKTTKFVFYRKIED
jgi:16S rRNA (guanine(966)-N(2))-methyltransferase RsmD